MFWIAARTCFTLYRWFPLFGKLRASIAIIQREGKFLAIQRNDGRGFSLPGGISGRKETAEASLDREVREETGLRVMGKELLMEYFSDADVPCDLSVFKVQAGGELKSSWEGSPQWMTLDELEPRLLESQRPVLELLRKMSANAEASNRSIEGS